MLQLNAGKAFGRQREQGVVLRHRGGQEQSDDQRGAVAIAHGYVMQRQPGLHAGDRLLAVTTLGFGVNWQRVEATYERQVATMPLVIERRTRSWSRPRIRAMSSLTRSGWNSASRFRPA